MCLSADERLEFFEKRIRPVLVEHCYECHAADADKVQGGLLLDSRAGWRSGGDSGPAVVPGKPQENDPVERLNPIWNLQYRDSAKTVLLS